MFLNRFSRVELAQLPTPLQEMKRLQAYFGGPRLLVKRDDLTGLGLGGNKLRKLEYLMADVLESGADTVITTGGIQSNHAHLTAAAARKLGLDAVLVLSGSEPPYYQGNLLIDRLLGAELRYVAGEPGRIPGPEVDEAMEGVADELRSRGKKPYIVPLGGSVPLGVMGYIGCMYELADQLWRRGERIDHVFVGGGSAGTAAGVALGLWLLGADVHTHVISVGNDAQTLQKDLDDLVVDTATVLDVETRGIGDTITVYDGYIGDGYGALTPDGLEAIELVATQEAIILDTVYTGKTAAGMFDLLRQGVIARDDTALFLHTGGSTGLFAKADVLSDRL